MKNVIYFICILLLNAINISAQVTVANNNAGGSNFVGWDNSVTIPLQIRQDHISPAFSIEFWTNQIHQMELDGASGNLGIGNSVIANPQYKLTVENNIDIEGGFGGPATEGMLFNGSYVLTAPWLDNIFVGIDAGKQTYGDYNSRSA
jgi:hypothetical protein